MKQECREKKLILLGWAVFHVAMLQIVVTVLRVQSSSSAFS